MRNSGRFPQGKPAATESHARLGLFVSVSFQNPPNFDMDYTIVISLTCRTGRDHSFACGIHTGVGYTDSESAQQFQLTRKNSHIFLSQFFFLQYRRLHVTVCVLPRHEGLS